MDGMLLMTNYQSIKVGIQHLPDHTVQSSSKRRERSSSLHLEALSRVTRKTHETMHQRS